LQQGKTLAQEERRLAAILAADVAGYSGLTEVDEAGTVSRLGDIRSAVVDPTVARFVGRIVKSTGDGFLAEFPSAVHAVECGMAIQEAMAARNADVPQDRRILFRLGINLGDVIVKDGDIFGGGVNVAARLEAMAAPGGILLSEEIVGIIGHRIDANLDDLGWRRLKNISDPVHVFRLLAGAKETPGAQQARPTGTKRSTPSLQNQTIRFCKTPDGVRIAYATVGSGAPLVKAANWLTHLEYDWNSPIWHPFLAEMARDHLLVRYDERGNGLSDWQVEDLSFESFVRDLETVVDALALKRFAVLGVSQGCAVSIAYAVRHPDRVTHLVLHGGYAKGWRRRANEQEIRRREALLTLVRDGWGADVPAFREVFTSLYVPDGDEQQKHWWTELQRVCTSPENAVRLMDEFANIDVTGLLPMVTVPTLVLHCRAEAVVPFDAGRQIAGGIAGARFVPLDSHNHIVLAQEPAWPKFVGEIRAFLAP